MKHSDIMIDEKATFDKYGYYSTDLKPRTGKRVVAVCDDCGAVRCLRKADYRDFCPSCSRKGERNHHFGKKHTLKTRLIIRKAVRKHDATHGRKKNPPHTNKARQHMSATKQGIPYEDWKGFATENLYCEKFDEACRERIRSKYDNKCFMCDKPQDENITKNGKQILLAVHHYDMNKDAGCNGNAWKLVPLCLHCHGGAHTKTWTARIEYLLNNVYNTTIPLWPPIC